MPTVRFELELLGGGIERRYRKARPEVEAMPWGTLELAGVPESVLLAARRSWTGAAFQEYRTSIACSLTQRALLEAQAPLDLIALASRFPLDELVHVELCARMAAECGGATEILYDPQRIVVDAAAALPPLLRAAELATRFFCVGEALSIPLLHGSWRASLHPLPRAVLGRIVRDEAAHGLFGWRFLDWALPSIDGEGRAHLAAQARLAIGAIRATWDELRARPRHAPAAAHALGWMETDAYLELAQRSLETRVLAPLRERDIAV